TNTACAHRRRGRSRFPDRDARADSADGPASVGPAVCERRHPVEPVRGELQSAPARAEDPRRRTRRGRNHRLPRSPWLPGLVCERPLVNDVGDVEKRWRDPAALRQAVEYGLGVIVVAAVAFAVFAVVDKGSVVLASTVPAILFLGGI